MKIRKISPIIFIVLLAFTIRLIPLEIPFFTGEEARVAYRGYTLTTYQSDELGRKIPLVFNSLSDYQLPLVSYITALGIAIFGKNNLGARLMFIIIGTLIVYLTYRLSRLVINDQKAALLSALVVAFSPALIFFSKIPNEFIILGCLLVWLIELLIWQRIPYILIFFVIVLLYLTAKISWLVVPPLIALVVFSYQHYRSKSSKLIIPLFALLLSILFFGIFLQIPQGKRSLLENNFQIFQDGAFKNGIDTLRGQGLESHLPNFIERIFFNKTYVFIFGVIHWFSQLQPSILFSKFDESNQYGFSGMGAYSKILIIPFLMAIVLIMQKNSKLKFVNLLLIPLVVTYPLIFIYPRINQQVIILALPFFSLLIGYGLSHIPKLFRNLVIGIFILEFLINFMNFTYETKISSTMRPDWVKNIVLKGYELSLNNNVAFSDDITTDIASYLQWYTPTSVSSNLADIRYPYKVRQTKLGDIRVIGSSDVFYKCGLDQPTYIFASPRDEKEIRRWLNIKPNELVRKIYKDDLANNQVFFFEPKICVH